MRHGQASPRVERRASSPLSRRNRGNPCTLAPLSRQECATAPKGPLTIRNPEPRLGIGFVLARRFTLCAFASFVDVLRLAADEGDGSRPVLCSWRPMSPTPDPVDASCGIRIRPEDRPGDPRQFDYFVVIGGLNDGNERMHPGSVAFLQRAARPGLPLELTTRDALVRRAFLAMQQTIDAPVPVTRLAEGLEVSRRTLERRFATAPGLSPLEVCRKVRLAQARHLPQRSARTVSEIAADPGFCDASHLIRAETGTTPEARRARKAAEGAERRPEPVRA